MSIKKYFIAKSFKITSKQVLGLTDEKIIYLSQPKVRNNDAHSFTNNIEVLHNYIQPSVGTYSVILGMKPEKEDTDMYTQEIKVTVTKTKPRLHLFIITLLLVTLVIIFFWYNSRSSKITSGLPDVTTEKMSEVELKKYAEKQVDKSNVTIQVYPKVLIESDGESGSMYIQNIPSNLIGQVAILKELKTHQELYTSDLLKPGYQVSKIKLSRKLKKGTHPGIVTLVFYDLKKEKQIGQTNVSVTITVL